MFVYFVLAAGIGQAVVNSIPLPFLLSRSYRQMIVAFAVTKIIKWLFAVIWLIVAFWKLSIGEFVIATVLSLGLRSMIDDSFVRLANDIARRQQLSGVKSTDDARSPRGNSTKARIKITHSSQDTSSSLSSRLISEDQAISVGLAMILLVVFFTILFVHLQSRSWKPRQDESTTNGMDVAAKLPQRHQVRHESSKPVIELADARPEDILLEEPLPWHNQTQAIKVRRFAPLTIHTSPGGYYLVKLIDPTTNWLVMTVFIHGGQTAKVDAPIGTYDVRYGAGQKWYGYEKTFGKKGAYTKGDSPLTFYTSGDQIVGHTLTLYKVTNGNFETSGISYDDF